jgi:hypothetical protein
MLCGFAPVANRVIFQPMLTHPSLPAANVALLGGEVHLTFSRIPGTRSHPQSGRVSSPGVGLARRLPWLGGRARIHCIRNLQ